MLIIHPVDLVVRSLVFNQPKVVFPVHDVTGTQVSLDERLNKIFDILIV